MASNNAADTLQTIARHPGPVIILQAKESGLRYRIDGRDGWRADRADLTWEAIDGLGYGESLPSKRAAFACVRAYHASRPPPRP